MLNEKLLPQTDQATLSLFLTTTQEKRPVYLGAHGRPIVLLAKKRPVNSMPSSDNGVLHHWMIANDAGWCDASDYFLGVICFLKLSLAGMVGHQARSFVSHASQLCMRLTFPELFISVRCLLIFRTLVHLMLLTLSFTCRQRLLRVSGKSVRRSVEGIRE